jgi:hypothetical protein
VIAHLCRRRPADVIPRRAGLRIRNPLPRGRRERGRCSIAFLIGAFAALSVHSLRGMQTASLSATTATTPVTATDSSAQSVATSPHNVFDRPARYVYAPDSGQIPRIEQAIDKGVAHMFVLARGIARGRLERTNKLPRTLQLVITPDSVGTQLDADRPMSLPRSGTIVRWDDGMGDECRAREFVVADTLTQLCAADRGSSVTRYVLENNGQYLQRTVHITSPSLSASIDYAVRFRRSPDATVPEPSAQARPPETSIAAGDGPERDGTGTLAARLSH